MLDLLTRLYALPLLLVPSDGGQPIPDGSATAPPVLVTAASKLIGVAKWGGLVVCVVGLIVTAATLWRASRGQRTAEAGEALLYVGIGAVLIGGAAGIIGWFVA